MSKYTTQLRYYIDNIVNDETLSIIEKCNRAETKIFEAYNIFDDSYRKILNSKILRHFYFYEIGFETVGLFKEFLNVKMSEIMPYYNELYKSVIDDLPVFDDVNYSETTTSKETGTTADSGITENSSDTDTMAKQKTKTDGSTNVTDRTTVTREGTETTTTDFLGGESSSVTMAGTENRTTTMSGTENRTTTMTGSETHTPNLTTVDKFSDTPEGSLYGVTSDTYLTTANQHTETGTTTTGFNNRQNADNLSFNNRQNADNLSFNNRKNITESEFDERQDKTTLSFDDRTDSTFVNSITTTGVDTESEAESNTATKGTVTTENNSETEKNGILTKIVKGKTNNKSYAEILQEYRKSIINIDLMIIAELECLFMQVY